MFSSYEKVKNQYSKENFISSIYNTKIKTSYYTFSIGVNNYLQYPTVFYNVYTDEKIQIIRPYSTFLNPFSLKNNVFTLVDYQSNITRYYPTKFAIIIFENDYIDITNFEKDVYRGLSNSITLLNNGGGVLGHYIRTRVISVKRLETELQNPDNIVFFGLFNNVIRNNIYPLFKKYNKLLWFIGNFNGNECKRNIIYTGLFPSQRFEVLERSMQLNNLHTCIILINDDDTYSASTYQEYCLHSGSSIAKLYCINYSQNSGIFPLNEINSINFKKSHILLFVMFGQINIFSETFLKNLNDYVKNSEMAIKTDLSIYQLDESLRSYLNNTYLITSFFEELINDNTIEKYSYIKDSYSSLLSFISLFKELNGDAPISYLIYNSYVTSELWINVVRKASSFDIDEILKLEESIILTPYAISILRKDHHIDRPLMIGKYVNNKYEITMVEKDIVESSLFENHEYNSIITCDFSDVNNPKEQIKTYIIPIVILYKSGEDNENNLTSSYIAFTSNFDKSQSNILYNFSLKRYTITYNSEETLKDALDLLSTFSDVHVCILITPFSDLQYFKSYDSTDVLFYFISDYFSSKYIQKNLISIAYNEKQLSAITASVFNEFKFDKYITLEINDKDFSNDFLEYIIPYLTKNKINIIERVNFTSYEDMNENLSDILRELSNNYDRYIIINTINYKGLESIISAYKLSECRSENQKIIFYCHSYDYIEKYINDLNEMIFIFDYMKTVSDVLYSETLSLASGNTFTGDEKSYHAYLSIEFIFESYSKCLKEFNDYKICDSDKIRLGSYNHSIENEIGEYEILTNNELNLPLSYATVTNYGTLFVDEIMTFSSESSEKSYARPITYYNIDYEIKIVINILCYICTAINIICLILLILNRYQSIIIHSNIYFCIAVIFTSELSIVYVQIISIDVRQKEYLCIIKEVIVFLILILFNVLYISKVFWFYSINATGLISLPYSMSTFFKLFIATFLIYFIYLIVWLSIDVPHVISKEYSEKTTYAELVLITTCEVNYIY